MSIFVVNLLFVSIFLWGVVALPIMQILNLSISLSTVPDKSKISKLKPLFKKGSRTDSKNYRPISLLPLISKIFERAIHDQLQHFLEENKILYKYQSGFRKNHSTNTCLSHLSNKILQGFDEGMVTGVILIDLQKAFDTIDHSIFLKKNKVLWKINGILKFLHRKNEFLTAPLRRLLCNALVQPHFDYASSAWYPNLSKKMLKKLKFAQNKCIRFCLQTGNRKHVGYAEYERIDWLPTELRHRQSVCALVQNFFENKCPA